MNDPKQFYAGRLIERQRELSAIRRRYDLIAWSRLATFLTGLILLILSLWAHLGARGWYGAAIAFAMFAILVFVHSRVADRLNGGWTRFAADGSSFHSDDHPYALDLDIFGKNSLFQLLNDTRTPFGEQTLARWLSEPAPAADIRFRQKAVQELRGLHDLREQLAVAGTRAVEHPTQPEPLLRWCDSPRGFLPSPWLALYSWISPAFIVITLSLTAWYPIPVWPAALAFAVNMALLATLRSRINPVVDAISKRADELTRFSAMLRILERRSFESDSLRDLGSRLRSSGAGASVEISRLARLVSMLDARQNGVFRAFMGPALLWDIHWTAAIERWKVRVGRSARGWLDALGSFETLCCFAAHGFENPSYTTAEIDEDAMQLQAEGLGHPLLDERARVVNDLSLSGPGSVLLVTGSNMSGKSTLLRSMGVAAVLALAGAPVCASRLRIGVCDVRTSMRVSDSLRDGVSRFYAELLKIKRVVQTAQAGRPVLFLLDEILHGTNSRERHIGARSIIRTLADRGAMGAVSTHDLALADLDRVLNVHFEEQVVDGKMTFDYRLRDGVVRSGNALLWMRQVGLEVEDSPAT